MSPPPVVLVILVVLAWRTHAQPMTQQPMPDRFGVPPGAPLPAREQARLQAELVARLLAEQRSDGAWGALAGRDANVEATAFALMGLSAATNGAAPAAAAMQPDTGVTAATARPNSVAASFGPAELNPAISRAAAWLVSTQADDGSWSSTAGAGPCAQASPWATAEAVLALAGRDDGRAAARAGAQWLVTHKGSGARLLTRLLYRWFPETLATELNPQLLAWPWVLGTASWVEPTSFALLALKRMRNELDGEQVEARIGEAEAMLYDRMCYGGGWNYGNRRVYDVDVPPYADTTALALIALQDHAGDAANRRSLATLETLAAATPTGLSLSLTMICLSLYGADSSSIARRAAALATSYRNTAFLGETRLAGLALVALAGRGHALEVVS